MSEALKAPLRHHLGKEILLREGYAKRLFDIAAQFEQDGMSRMAQEIWDLWRHNEVERMKLQAQIDALDS